jgi:DNA-binding NarL/FixJ family response regulator
VVSGPADIRIIGPRQLQNELLAWFIRQSHGLTCACFRELHPELLLSLRSDRSDLILLDCLGENAPDFWQRRRYLFDLPQSKRRVALFNVENGGGSNHLLRQGVRGVFFANDSLAVFAKGIKAIKRGELWFSRETLVQCLFDDSGRNRPGEAPGLALTGREKEVLTLIASGVTNPQIAARLGISTNTVKTHVYNIFHKIKVPNRLQAALWAAKNL